MHNVIAFIGSLRKDSVNRQVYNVYSELAKNDFKMTEIDIAPMPLSAFMAENKCRSAQ